LFSGAGASSGTVRWAADTADLLAAERIVHHFTVPNRAKSTPST